MDVLTTIAAWASIFSAVVVAVQVGRSLWRKMRQKRQKRHSNE
jgi:hypothetical protein